MQFWGRGTCFAVVTKEKYKIRQEINCCSRKVIYFQARTSNHISHIIQQEPTCGIVKHFLYTERHSIEDFGIMGIVGLEKLPKSPKDFKKMLKEFEGYWQIKMQSLEPHGIKLFDEVYNAEYHDRAGCS